MAGIGAVYGDIISLEVGSLDYWTGIVCGSVCTVDCYWKVRILDNFSFAGQEIAVGSFAGSIPGSGTFH